NEWTWMKGPNTANTLGTFGTQGVAAPNNTPTFRSENNGTWVGNSDELWMCGDYSDDMWKYDPASNNWTWMSGGSTPAVLPVWGVLQTPSSSNTPGSRSVYSRWKDRQGNFWLWGGYGQTGTYNDMWKYDPVNLEWTWMGGTQVVSSPATFQTTCVYGTEVPAGSYEGRTCWTDECGNFWQFGGFDVQGTGNPAFSAQNSLWMFNPNTLQFNWIGGTLQLGQPSVYGTFQIPAAANQPGGFAGGVGFTSLNGDFWMFGGYTDAAQMSNSVWRYQRSAACPAPQPSAVISINPTAGGCAPLPVSFLAPSGPGSTYNWNFGDPAASNDVSVAAQPSYTYNTGGTYTVTLIVSNNGATLCQLPNDTANTVITVLNSPSTELGNNRLLCNSQTATLDAGNSGIQYNWNTGEITQSITVSTPGLYTVQVSNGTCIITDSVRIDFSANNSLAAPLNVFTPNGDGTNDVFGFPNAAPENFDLEIYSRWGNSLFRSNNPVQGWDGTFNGSSAEEGVYYWRLRLTDCFGNPEEKSGFVTLMR
ncbi:MAG: gliding motility-associated C-terminal domain-containing protein, partial [Bacteroidia bacterium]